jgi:hypothetical protein
VSRADLRYDDINQHRYFREEVCIPCEPQELAVGNIVEFGIGVIFIWDSVIKARRMKVVLRSITKLSDYRYHVSQISNNQSTII